MWNWNVFLLRYICYFNVGFVNKIILGKYPYCSYDDTVFMSGYWHIFDLSNWFSLSPVQNTQGSFMSLLCEENTSRVVSARQLSICSEGMGLVCLPFLFGAERKWFHSVAWPAVSPVACLSVSVFCQTPLQIWVLSLFSALPVNWCLPSFPG